MSKLARVSFKILDLLIIFVMTFGAPMTVLADPSPTGATIVTELPDYPPGATVLMTGAGWVADEGVHVVVSADDQSWMLESNPDPIADSTGGFTYEFQLPNWFVQSYTVAATGFTSGTATVTFTDLNIGTYDQCSNDDGDGYASGDAGCRWINGNLQHNNSVYFEGDATVQRLWLTGFAPGSTHTVTFKYGTTKGGKHAYDFLTSWNWSENWISVADRCQDITGCDTAAETYTPIPVDPNANGFDAAANGIQARRFTMRGGMLNSASTPIIFSGSYAGDSETVTTVNFTVANSGSMCPTSGPNSGTCGVAIWFGAHVAAQANWGLGNGAGSISGSPYHVALDAVDSASVGQRDNQMQADAVTFFPNGTIIIIKDAQPNDAQDFSFSLSSSTIIQNFFLDDDSDATLPNTTAPQYSVPPGTYTAKELNIPSGWSLAGLSCTVSGGSGSTFTTDLGTGTATINLVSVGNTTTGDTVTCTFVDTRNVGSLRLTKSLTGGPQGYTGPFTIVYDCDGTAYDGSVSVSAGSSQTVSGIPSGTSCTVSEPTLPAPPGDYTFGTPTFSPSATVIIGAGATVEVTTNNTLTHDQGYLKISKVFDPKTSGFNGTFDVVYNCGSGNQTVSLAAGGSTTVGPFDTGTSCTVSEPTLPTAPSGWTFGTPSVSGSPATIVQGDQAAAVVVTVTNSISRDLGNLKISKTLSNPDGASVPASFSVDYDCGPGYTGSVTVAPGSPATVNGIPTGSSCSVTEVAPAAIPGFTWGTVTYTPASVTIDTNGGTFEITVGNSITRDRGSLKISKTLSNPDGASVPASFSVDYDCGPGYTGNVSVAPGSPATVSGIPTGSTCTVTEVAPAAIPGFTWGTVTYTPASVTINSNGGTFEITVGNSISRDRGSLKITKTLSNPDDASVPASFAVDYDCGAGYMGQVNVAPGGSATVSGIPTGNTCSVTEVTPAAMPGYTWGTVTYTPASIVIGTTTGTFEIVVGNSITRDRGSLKITKTTSNPDGATLPASFTGTYDCGGGYSGNFSVANGASQTFSGIPTGSVCSVTETTPAPIPGYTWGTITYTPSSITIDTKDQTFEIVVGNSITRDLGSLVLAKSLNDGGSGFTGPFTIHWDCGTFGSGDESINAGGTATISNVPTGTSCTVSEPTLPSVTGYSFGIPTFSPSATVVIPAGNGSSITVTTSNTMTRDLGSLKIYKTLSNPDGAPVPASFTVNYDCGTGYTGSVSVAPGSPATVSGIPTGNTCSITEVTPTAIPNYTWGAITYSPSSSVVIADKGATYSLTVGNSITRDRGSLTVVKKVVNDNGGTATVSAFGVNTNAGSLTFDSGSASGYTTTYSSQMMTVVTGTYTLKENDIYGYTEGSWSCTGAAGTVVPTFSNGSVQVAKNENVVCTITNNDLPGTIIVQKLIKPTGSLTSFSFNTTGTGYTGFSLAGGQTNSQTLNAGSYTVKELVPLGWVLTGIGGSTDPNTPYNCTVNGSGGSTGLGDLNTQTATVSLKNGDTVTCVFENTGQGVTRTQGFWATHPQLAQIAWFGGTAFGHTFPGVSDKVICPPSGSYTGRIIADPGGLGKLMGAFWSDVSKTSTGAKRSALDQARMQLLQQLIAAELNTAAFGSVPANGSIAAWESAYCGTNQNAIKTAQQQAASFNTAGDSGIFTPGTSADSKNARAIANYVFWNVLP